MSLLANVVPLDVGDGRFLFLKIPPDEKLSEEIKCFNAALERDNMGEVSHLFDCEDVRDWCFFLLDELQLFIDDDTAWLNLWGRQMFVHVIEFLTQKAELLSQEDRYAIQDAMAIYLAQKPPWEDSTAI